MGKYLKKFQNHTEYEAFTATTEFIKPNVSLCVQENEVHYNPWTYADAYLTFKALEDGTFKLSTNAVSYSLDNGKTWTSLAKDTSTPTVTAGSKILWKASGLQPTSSNGIGTFSSTARFDVQGNPMSLLYGDDFKGKTSLSGKNYAFKKLFDGCRNLVSAENLSLPATTLAIYCYTYMFYGCKSLTTAPQLPATTLTDNCYYYMFRGCTSLTTAPQLPATTLTDNCYYGMFNECTALTTAPQLPATTLATSCYREMFQRCTALTTAPELPATTLVSNCYYYMFNGCKSLTTAPELPATTLVSNCYNSMFRGCNSLNYIKAMFTTAPSTSYTNNWVNDVASSGIFVKNSAATWNVTGVNGIPRGWTVQTASA